MLVATALAVYLIVRPPGETDSAPVVVGRTTPTATVENAQATVPPQTPAGTSTPAGTATPAISPTPTESPFLEYVIQEGDTLFDIAEANLAPGDDIEAFARAIANLNNIDFDNPILPLGETILLPRPPAP